MAAKNLTVEQEGLLETVRRAVGARAAARMTLENEARRMVLQGLRDADLVVAQTVKTAVEGGISKRRVGLEGLRTSDYGTVLRTLELLEPAAGAVAAPAVEQLNGQKVRLATPAEMRKHGFPLTSTVARIDWADLSIYPGQEDPAKGFIDLETRRVLLDELNTDPNMGAIHTLAARNARNALSNELDRLESQHAAA